MFVIDVLFTTMFSAVAPLYLVEATFFWMLVIKDSSSILWEGMYAVHD
jgi:hypothetical protein